jgi:type 1 glutamine amidotransferase
MAVTDILILLGGEWHDFEGFERAMRSLLGRAGYSIQATYDPDTLTRLKELDCRLLLSYTCMTESPKGKKPDTLVKLNHAQVHSLVQWVQDGGALLAIHAATVLGDSGRELEDLLGGAFVSHPPQCTFQVIPLYAQHPVSDGIHAFDVNDELYIERYHPSVTIHMVAVHEQMAYPIVWSRFEGRGKVVHISLGHSQRTWELEPYQQLILQSIQWMITH